VAELLRYPSSGPVAAALPRQSSQPALVVSIYPGSRSFKTDALLMCNVRQWHIVFNVWPDDIEAA
jgi:hypothetical protein